MLRSSSALFPFLNLFQILSTCQVNSYSRVSYSRFSYETSFRLSRRFPKPLSFCLFFAFSVASFLSFRSSYSTFSRSAAKTHAYAAQMSFCFLVELSSLGVRFSFVCGRYQPNPSVARFLNISTLVPCRSTPSLRAPSPSPTSPSTPRTSCWLPRGSPRFCPPARGKSWCQRRVRAWFMH